MEDNNNLYEAEIDRLKRRVKVLDRRWKVANKRWENLKKKYKDMEEKQNALCNSFLGKTELKIWKFKKVVKLAISKYFPKLLEKYYKKKIDYNQEIGNNITNFKEKEVIKKADKEVVKQKPPTFMKENVKLNDVYVFDWETEFIKLRDRICDNGYLNTIENMLSNLPESSGSRYFGKLPYKIGIIADEFLLHSYKGATDLIYLTPDEYKYDIDFLLVASTWRGLNEEWVGLGSTTNDKVREKLYSIIEYYKGLNKKIIYYSKEDPSNYYVFLDIAKRCDYIFTTAEECVEEYKKDTGNKNVDVLDFAINPLYYNPVGSQQYNLEGVVFAGTWWNKKYIDRMTDMQVIFDKVLQANKKLKIIDRNYSKCNPSYFYPNQYLEYVSPEVSHDILQKVHRLYSWAININSIKNSNTMFAGRVYELQALGNLIISNHNIGMERKFPNVIIEDGSGSAAEALTTYSDERIYELKATGIRNVMTGETVFDRINFILECIGEQTVNLEKKIGIIIPDNWRVDLWSMAEKQTYKNKEIISKQELTNELYNSWDMVAFFEPGNEYESFYIEDMINGFKYTDCDFITKSSYYINDCLVKGEEHNYVTDARNKERTVYWTKSFSMQDALEPDDTKNNYLGYSIDYLNYRKIK